MIGGCLVRVGTTGGALPYFRLAVVIDLFTFLAFRLGFTLVPCKAVGILILVVPAASATADIRSDVVSFVARRLARWVGSSVSQRPQKENTRPRTHTQTRVINKWKGGDELVPSVEGHG